MPGSAKLGSTCPTRGSDRTAHFRIGSNVASVGPSATSVKRTFIHPPPANHQNREANPCANRYVPECGAAVPSQLDAAPPPIASKKLARDTPPNRPSPTGRPPLPLSSARCQRPRGRQPFRKHARRSCPPRTLRGRGNHRDIPRPPGENGC